METPARALLAPAPPPLSGLPRIARALRVFHPFPTLLNVAATIGLAFIAAGGVPGGGELARMALVMLFAQSAIGAANDAVDRDLDAVTKPWKPIPSRALTASAAAAVAVALAAAALALAATLGVASFALAALGLACGLAYDLRLKRTPLSALPWMVAMPTLPAWVWVTLGDWQPVLWWLLPLGALIGLALHIANTLPDIEADRAAGVYGFAHRLGAAWSMLVAWGAFAAALSLSLAVAPVASYDWRVYGPTLAFGIAASMASGLLFALRRDGSALQLGWGVLSIAAAVLAAGWLAAVT